MAQESLYMPYRTTFTETEVHRSSWLILSIDRFHEHLWYCTAASSIVLKHLVLYCSILLHVTYWPESLVQPSYLHHVSVENFLKIYLLLKSFYIISRYMFRSIWPSLYMDTVVCLEPTLRPFYWLQFPACGSSSMRMHHIALCYPSCFVVHIFMTVSACKIGQTWWPLARKQTIPTERTPPVGEF
jgi:hypothetical protein